MAASNQLSTIAGLIDLVEDAVQSDRNQARNGIQPAAVFGFETPIAEAKIFGLDVNHLLEDPAFYVEYELRKKLWRWRHVPGDDAAITLDLPAWLGHYPEYTLVGLDVEFTPDGIPNIQTDHPLTRDPDLHLLHPFSFMTSGWMPRAMRWYDDLVEIADGRLNVTFNMVWWRGCLDLAIQLRGYENFVLDCYARPDFVHDLMRFLVEQRIRWWDAYYKYFDLKVSPTSIGDDWINVPFITPSMFADFVLPRYLELEQFHGGISHIHSCGNQVPVQRYLLEIQSLPGMEISAWSDLEQSLENIPLDKALAVVLHPNDVLLATAQEMESRLRHIVEKCQGRRYRIGTAGLTPITDNISDYVGQIKKWTQVAQKVLGPLRMKTTP